MESHLERVLSDARDRGGIGGIALTHDHLDHAEAIPELRRRAGEVPVAAARYEGADVRLDDGERFGPLRAIATPGHAPDHLAYVAGGVCFSGDAVLGEGSVFVWPDPGALSGYLSALRRLRVMGLKVICPGHGPVVLDANAKLDEYVAHRLERERKLVEALEAGLRSADDLVDRVWSDAPAALRPAATVTLAAHLDKLEDEGRLPDDVERPQLSLRGEA
jgi:glyoxylase-like metal-dependent hydrolase (beta-lactamase superfamily II)